LELNPRSKSAKLRVIERKWGRNERQIDQK
jgi:hypothetical protein